MGRRVLPGWVAMRRNLLPGLMACALALATLTTPVAAAEPPVPGRMMVAGVALAVDAADVSGSDDDLADTDREVVVVSADSARNQVTKLRAATEADALRIITQLQGLPGVTAAPNLAVALPGDPGRAARRPADARARFDVGGAGAARVRDQRLTIAKEPYGSQQWGLYAVGAEDAWPVSRGKGVKVAVVDTGVDRTHPDLAGRSDAQVDVVLDGRSGDVRGHGTHVAGIIAAALNGVGVAGLANQATILPVRVFGASGAADSYTIASGIYRAIDRGAAVINLSLTSAVASAVEKKAVADAVAKGISVVASGGNAFDDGNRPQYPAAYSGVLGVTSVNRAGERSWFANTGQHIDLAAPGEDIVSTYPGGAYERLDGTSMAAPFVSAAAALVRAANPSWGAAAVRDALQGTAQDDSSGNGRDTVFGFGLVRADRAAVKAARAPGGVSSTPTPAHSPSPTPSPITPQPKPIAVRAVVARAGFGNVLAVNVDPDRGAASYTFTVQQWKAGGGWATRPGVYRTLGPAEARFIVLGRGAYRVVVRADGRYTPAVSAPVHLTDPTVRVSVGRDKKGNKLTLDVDPNRAGGHWVFRVQKLKARKWMTLRAKHRTSGPAETRRINLKKGTYRVVVTAGHGYRGAVSAAVRLVR
jgi:type VII secretion-associated serine protease mycosin